MRSTGSVIRSRISPSAITRLPLVMPPRSPLGYGFELVQFNWRKAKTALERAREIHIIGYSLPDADMAFHNLVASVRSAWSEALTVDVWNPDPVVGTRAQSLFGE